MKRKIFIYILGFIVCVLCIYTFVILFSEKDNDNIVMADSNISFRNENPSFSIDFINGQYIKFETISSYINPIDKNKPNIFERIKSKLNINQERRGIEISLKEVSYDSELEKISGENIDGKKLNKSIKLEKIGREFGNDSVASKDTVVSKNIYEGVDIQYQVIKGKGLKEEIVLNEIPQYKTECSEKNCMLPVNRFVFEIKLDKGLSIKKNVTATDKYPNGVIYILDEKGNYFAHFLPEYAIDSVGVKTSKVISNIVSNGDKYIYEIVLDSQWLLDKDRVFPIKIDPSIVHDTQFVFEQGEFDRVRLNNLLNIDLKNVTSGEYISPSVEIGSNAIINNIEWQSFGQATKDGQTPFSKLDLLIEENFDNIQSSKNKWGAGALQLSEGEEKRITVNSSQSGYISVQFWSYRRKISDSSKIFSSNLGDLIIEEDKYVFKDSNNTSYSSEVKVKYNKWEHIALVFGTTNSNVSLYIDGIEYSTDVSFNDQKNLSSIQLFGSGYFDALRVYERMLAKSEVLSDSQYTDIYLQYAVSRDNVSWSDWVSKSEYPVSSVFENGNTEISLNSIDFSKYNMMYFEFLAKDEGYISAGENKFSNGGVSEDINNLKNKEGVFDSIQAIKYIDFVFKSSSLQNSCLINIGDMSISMSDAGKVLMSYNQEVNELKDLYILEADNYISVLFSDDNTKIYLNGNLSWSGNTYLLTADQYKIGYGCSNMQNTFDGEIKNLRYSNSSQSEKDVLKYHTFEERKYLLKPVFRAKLQNNNQILGTQNTSFSITQQAFGADNYIVSLNKGDTIVVSEGEYIASGVVDSVEHDTGLVNIKEWENNSTFPPQGFSETANVLKWQSEYIPLKIGEELNIQYSNILDIRKVKLLSAFDNEEAVNIEEGTKYLKYKLIFISKYPYISASISSININIEESGPQMEQIMRHGKWFNENGKQSYWWAK